LKRRRNNFKTELLIILKKYKENPCLETFKKIVNLIKIHFEINN